MSDTEQKQKRERPDIDPLIMRAMSRAIFGAQQKAEGGSAENRKEAWAENREQVTKMARFVIGRLEHEGVTMKMDEAKAAQLRERAAANKGGDEE